MKRRLIYFSLSVLCFMTCVLIVKLFSGNNLIRGFIGDIVVIPLIYFLIKSLFDFNAFKLAAATLILAYLIEAVQYFKMASLLGFEDNVMLRLVLGSVFDPRDLTAYTIGAVLAYIIDVRIIKPAIRRVK